MDPNGAPNCPVELTPVAEALRGAGPVAEVPVPGRFPSSPSRADTPADKVSRARPTWPHASREHHPAQGKPNRALLVRTKLELDR
jgi:hypothetical protein